MRDVDQITAHLVGVESLCASVRVKSACGECLVVPGIGLWKIERLRLAEISRDYSGGEMYRLRT